MRKKSRKKRQKTKPKKPEVEPDTNKVSFSRRKALVGLGLVLGYGGLELSGLGLGRLLYEPERELPQEWSFLKKQLDRESQNLFVRFLEENPEKQKEILKEMQQVIDRESSMLSTYSHIIEVGKPELITLEELANIDVPYAQNQYKKSKKRSSSKQIYFVYDSAMDKIIVPPLDNAEKLAELLTGGLTTSGILAHETLHKIQNHANPRLYQLHLFLFPYLHVDGKYSFDDKALEEFGEKFMGKPVSFKVAQAYIHTITIQDERTRVLLRELNTQCLTVKMNGRSFDLPRYHPHIERMNPRYINESLGWLSVAYGYYSSQGKPLEIDINVAKLVGKSGDTLEMLKEEIEELTKGKKVYYSKKGVGFFQERSRQLKKGYKAGLKFLQERL